MRKPRPKTGAERQQSYVASGRQIAVVLRDPVAIEALDALSNEHGGVTGAVTHALREAARPVDGKTTGASPRKPRTQRARSAT